MELVRLRDRHPGLRRDATAYLVERGVRTSGIDAWGLDHAFVWTNRVFLALAAAVIFMLPHLLNPEASARGGLTVLLNYFLGPGLVWVVVSLIDGTTELAIGAHFANNIGGVLLITAAGSAITAPALFTVSEYHATFGALSVLVIVPVFLAISYKVFKRDEASEPVSRSHRKDRR